MLKGLLTSSDVRERRYHQGYLKCSTIQDNSGVMSTQAVRLIISNKNPLNVTLLMCSFNQEPPKCYLTNMFSSKQKYF